MQRQSQISLKPMGVPCITLSGSTGAMKALYLVKTTGIHGASNCLRHGRCRLCMLESVKARRNSCECDPEKKLRDMDCLGTEFTGVADLGISEQGMVC